MLLMRTRQAVMQRFRPHLRKHDITDQQWRILGVLAEERATSMAALAVRSSILPPSLSRTIRLLLERGLVRRCINANDQRRTLIDLTPRGWSTFRALSAESAKIDAELENEIGLDRLGNTYQLLIELTAIANLTVRPATLNIDRASKQ